MKTKIRNRLIFVAIGFELSGLSLALLPVLFPNPHYLALFMLVGFPCLVIGIFIFLRQTYRQLRKFDDHLMADEKQSIN